LNVTVVLASNVTGKVTRYSQACLLPRNYQFHQEFRWTSKFHYAYRCTTVLGSPVRWNHRWYLQLGRSELGCLSDFGWHWLVSKLQLHYLKFHHKVFLILKGCNVLKILFTRNKNVISFYAELNMAGGEWPELNRTGGPKSILSTHKI